MRPLINLREYFDECEKAFQRAQKAQPEIEHALGVAGLRIRLRFAGPALVPAVMPAFAHLYAASPSAPTITVALWDSASTAIHPPRPPFRTVDYRRYGQRGLLNDRCIALMHAPVAGLLFAYDRQARKGFFWTPDAADLSIYDRAAPLQTLLHWSLSEHGWHITHAAALGTEQGGLLLVGNTGAGKSTTALASFEYSGLRYLSDDKCLVTLDPEPQAFGLFNSAKLKADMLERLPHFRPLIAGWDGDDKAGKSLVFLHPAYRDRMVKHFAIRAILILRIVRQARPKLFPAAPTDAFRVLGPSTVIWLPGAEGSSLHFLARLVRAAPCYFMDLASEPVDNLAALAEVLRHHT